MCHQDIKEFLRALQGAVTSGDPTQQAIFIPLVLNLELDWAIISGKDTRVFFSSQASPHLRGPWPHCSKTVSWAVLLKGLFKLSDTLYCRRKHTAGVPRRADAAHLALPSSSAATTCCIGPNIHLRGAASQESGCNRNSFAAQFAADCSVPATRNTPVLCFELSLVSLL